MGFVNRVLISLSWTVTVWLRSDWHFTPLLGNSHTLSEAEFIRFCPIIVIQSLDWNAWLSCVYQSLSSFLIPLFFLKWVRFRSCTITAKNKESKSQKWKIMLPLCMLWNNGSKHTVIHVNYYGCWLKKKRLTHMHNSKFRFNLLPTTRGPQETE
jgi:hypothetical protein